jgi:ArsR family transcriptional regulator, arsenate/arsenite/antimonite-responsive transcriptional repressor
MAGNSHRELVALLQGLGNPNRLRLLNLLSDGEVCVCHLATCLQMVQPRVSRHLAYLKRAGLVTARRHGKWMYYSRTKHPHPAAGDVVNGLHTWMRRHRGSIDERAKLQRHIRHCAKAKPKKNK